MADRCDEHDDPVMVKRSVVALLWFVAVWCMYDLVAYFAGTPRLLGPVIGAALASFVGVDPLSLFWPGGSIRRAPRAEPSCRPRMSPADRPAIDEVV